MGRLFLSGTTHGGRLLWRLRNNGDIPGIIAMFASSLSRPAESPLDLRRPPFETAPPTRRRISGPACSYVVAIGRKIFNVLIRKQEQLDG